MKFIKILPIILFALIFSCNKIDIPVKEQGNTCGDDTKGNIRKILIEDYTGHKCNNCPQAAEILHEIKNNYCDHIIPIAIHVSNFAAPSSGTFENDYRTDAGNELNDFYKVSNEGLPNGLVNRRQFNDKYVVSKNEWETSANKIYDIPPEVNINIETIYNESTKEITAKITAEFLYNIDYNINIGIYVVEDSIISPQLTPNGIDENYVHMHMLRKAINGAFGEKLISQASIGNSIEKTYTFTKEDIWDINHLGIVAFISNTNSKEIIQAESEDILK